MQTLPLTWQSLTVQYPFSDETQPTTFFDFQPKAKKALNQFILSELGSAFILKTETFPEFLAEIEHYLTAHNIPSMTKMEFNRQQLFGYSLYLEKENRIETICGALQQANNKILILNINALLLDITQWDKLKQALLFGEYEQININAIPQNLSPIRSTFKLLLVGSRDDIATLAAYDDSLYQFSQYAEIESYLTLENKNIAKWGKYIQSLAERYTKKRFTAKALNQLLQQGIRDSENRELISISPTFWKKYILGIQYFYPNQTCFNDVQRYFDDLVEQAASLNQSVLKDILTLQLYIETEGETVGQINGLSIVEFDGVPYAFGEPLRISCNVQYGDGEIHDIERKVELGGNIHSKGILLAQSCLANLLELPTQLPFSASLAFEQSYGEIDGDSSSLAIFCVLMSALTKLPLPQSIAVTGAIDQFGNVLSVGGVNQKIEGFFNLCQARGLTGQQGVIIPTACVSHLSLNQAVVDAVKAEQFYIWAVNDLFEALEILFDSVFYDEDLPENSEKSSLFALVHQYIEQQNEETSGSFWQKICKKWKSH